MAKPGPSGVARLLRAFGYAFRGIALGLRHELAFRVEIATAALAVPVALLVGGNGLERVSDAYHPLAGRAKDMGAAALLLSLVLAASVWALILLG
jgi:diacylglycerol kinase (ATP)